MDYEKMYKEALERAREYWETDNDNTLDIKAKGTMEHLFPELAESEEKKILKELVSIVKSYRENCITEGNHRFDNCLAWLEKLKVFAEHGDGLYYFTNSEFTYVGNSYSGVSIGHDNGVDILFDKKLVKHISGEKQGEQKPAEWHREDEQNLNACLGYIPDEFLRRWLTDAILTKYDKTAWSEEDELHIRELESLVKQVRAIAEHENDKETINKMSNLSFFLKTLKPQLKQEWSEEDEKMIDTIIYDLERHGGKEDSCYLTEINWLKFLKQRCTWKPSEKLDEASYQVGIKRVLDNPESYGLTKYNWKPSEEQMHYLSWIANVKLGDSVVEQEVSKHLNKLYEELKKL